ncbi:uncharacterized protein AMSG_00480 [Thecamonas trahens ATCC 50062]|uniref:BTB domain-containing protein n=1 Tax=Thecamonas trahens ATCC 50062 TaxID=461836 RepID=A0A0L0DBM8_THETB|nr:hypothetical protein AMSG_00480 [Thecamonas trahens ATCC 50062]KNC48703.1 hypothetical protein AMSG_00480 [Thecamonas trahens ATCC 50062]|eukprot:XP_013762759.1 hypothetical protein AMSG_00480 [Thecamonas trahens ATCC 50062]
MVCVFGGDNSRAAEDYMEAEPDHKPSSRYFHTASYVADARVIIVFGGFAAGANLNDVYAFDVETREWIDASVEDDPIAGRPDSRSGHAATVVGGNAVVVFGGFSGTTRLADTWRLAVARTEGPGSDVRLVWKKLLDNGGGSGPPPTCNTDVAYDPESDVVYLFSGHAGVASSATLYALDGASRDAPAWRRVATCGMEVERRTGHTLHWYNGAVYVFGGESSAQLCATLLRCDVAEGRWEVVDTTPVNSRCFHAADVDSSTGTLLAMGGTMVDGLDQGLVRVHLPPLPHKLSLADDLDTAFAALAPEARNETPFGVPMALSGGVTPASASGWPARCSLVGTILAEYIAVGASKTLHADDGRVSVIDAARVYSSALDAGLDAFANHVAVTCLLDPPGAWDELLASSELGSLGPTALAGLMRAHASRPPVFGQQALRIDRMRQQLEHAAETGDYDLVANDGTRIRVHTFVLCARSPMCAALIGGAGLLMAEGASDDWQVRLGEAAEPLTATALQALVEFIYTGSVDLVLADATVAASLVQAHAYLGFRSEVLPSAVQASMDGIGSGLSALVAAIDAAKRAGGPQIVDGLLAQIAAVVTGSADPRSLRPELERLDAEELVSLVYAVADMADGNTDE